MSNTEITGRCWIQKIYLARRRVATSKITASARTAPLTTYWEEMSMPIRFVPLVKEIYTSTPISDPSTLPTPPAADRHRCKPQQWRPIQTRYRPSWCQIAVETRIKCPTARQQNSNYELTVLVVDDNTCYRQQLTHLIGKICPTSILYEAGNISEAIKLGQPVRPQLAPIDVVLEDEDGIQCACQLRSISPSTRMVVVSAYPDQGFRNQALSAGAVAFVDKKDLDTASLRQVIKDALR